MQLVFSVAVQVFQHEMSSATHEKKQAQLFKPKCCEGAKGHQTKKQMRIPFGLKNIPRWYTMLD